MTGHDEVATFLTQAVSRVFGVEQSELSPDTGFATELHAKSVDIVHLIDELEARYDREMPFMKIRRQQTIGELTDFVTTLLES